MWQSLVHQCKQLLPLPWVPWNLPGSLWSSHFLQWKKLPLEETLKGLPKVKKMAQVRQLKNKAGKGGHK